MFTLGLTFRVGGRGSRAAPPLRLYLWLVVVTGVRRGELCGLQIRDIDLDRGLVHVAFNYVVRSGRATPPGTIWRDFLDATGTLYIDDTSVTCALNLRSHHPALIDAGFTELETPIPWWGGRSLRFRFPPR